MRFFLALFSLAFPVLSVFAGMKDSGLSLGGVQSRYSRPIEELLQTWRKESVPSLLKKVKSTGLELQCLSTPANETYIGVAQYFRIHAPAQAVARVLDEVEHYSELFEGVEKSEVRGKKEDRFTIFTETNIPIPLVPNEKDEVLYLKSSLGGRTSYHYQLKSSNHLTASDGFILLVELAKDETAYIEYDFWDADWGMAKSFGVDKLWANNISSLAQTDLAIKLRAENPNWPLPHVKKEAEDQRDLLPISECVRTRHPPPIGD